MAIKTTSQSITSPNVPKRVLTPPNVGAMILSCILYLLLTVTPLVPGVIYYYIPIIFLLPFIIPLGVFFSYYLGLAIAKLNHNLIINKQAEVYLIMVAVHIIIVCIGLLLIGLLSSGYPIRMCAASCGYLSFTDATIYFLATSTIYFLSSYYAIYRYSKWAKIIGKKTKSKK